MSCNHPDRKLWVDDVRLPHEDGREEWDIAESYDEAIELLLKNNYDAISLDHDLGTGLTGMHILKWMYSNDRWPKNVWVHSMNPVAAKSMLLFIDDIQNIK
jgi:hypothetical protein